MSGYQVIPGAEESGPQISPVAIVISDAFNSALLESIKESNYLDEDSISNEELPRILRKVEDDQMRLLWIPVT